MSTVPQGSMHATVPEFNDETLYDPLLMSEAMSEEQLVHIHSQNHTPNPQPGFAPPTTNMEIGKSESSASGGVRMTSDSNTWFGRIDSGLSNSSLNFPFDPDNTPLAYGDGTFDANLIASSEQQLASPVEPPSRKSSGLATVSGESHLMSPTLTNDTNEPVSPITHLVDGEPYKLLGGGQMSRGSSLSTVNTSSYRYLHTTPAPTRSSAMTSPDPSADMRPVSPLVRVVDVGHGDASAHIVHTPLHAGKRAREQSRSNLHPEDAHHSYDDILNLDDDDDDEDDHIHNPSEGGVGGRSGVAPGKRTTEEETPSINEAAQSRKMSERNDQVASWLWTRDAPDSGSYLDPNKGLLGVRGRIRSKSQSKNSQQLRADAFRSLQGRRKAQDESTPGPDVLIDESSGDDEDGGSGSYQESAPASIDGTAIADEQQSQSSLSRLDSDDKNAESYFWSNPFRIPSAPGQRTQPGTSNAAIMRFHMRNLDPDVETASRAATWGTRRMSDSTIDQVFGSGGFFSRLKLTNSKEKEEDEHEIRSSLQEGVDHLRQRYRAFRSNSVNKRKCNDRPGRPVRRTDTYMRGVSPHERPDSSESAASSAATAATGAAGAAASSAAHVRKPSNGAFTNIMQRIPSTRRSGHSRPTTPRIETGSSKEDSKPPCIDTSHHSPPPSSPSSGGGFKEGFRRFREGLQRHLSDDSHSSSDTLAAMLHKTGGPPVPVITSQRAGQLQQQQQQQQPPQSQPEATLKPGSDADGDDDDDDDVATVRPEEKTEHAVKMPMSPSKDLIIPNFDGFKSNAKDVNPRLDPWLVERLGQEQLRRYKRLVEMKVQHYKPVAAGTCPSGDFCVAKGGQPRYFAPPKSSHKDSVSSGEADVPLEDMDEDEQAIAEGTVTEAQFPLGLPMPPVQRLPAEFECPFCFTVKKFTKPSDWSKHVHEDLQPFTCTFKNCSDPKSFKRKADWVRHENERHRQLEWWECTEEGCQHRCYRRDNFVQHLIREHKLPEPVTKPAKQPNKPAVRGPAKSKGRGRGNTTNINDVPPEEKVLLMVEICRHETKKNAVEERCRFCGNVCNSWKKLTVHLARHMEQLSIPVLELVKLREVSVDTIISPLEPRPPMQSSVSPVEQTSGNTFNSPHAFSTASSGTVQMPLTGNIMDPGAFALQDPNFGSAQFDSTGWATWPNPQAAAQIPYGGGYGAISQPGYGGAGDSSGATYMSQGNGRAIYMQDAGPQQPMYGSGSMADQQAVAMASGNVYGQQPQQHDSQQAYGQTAQWPGMQYGPSAGQQVAYDGVGRGATAQQHPQAHAQHLQQQSQQQQQYYGGQWQQ